MCPQLHLPVQSGSDRVLEKMERGYTAAEYLDLVERLRRAIPGIALTTDIIVGFPGEDEADFLATCELMRTVGYDSAFMFKYSARSGTKAFKWPETVSEEEKGRRLQTIIALQEEQLGGHQPGADRLDRPRCWSKGRRAAARAGWRARRRSSRPRCFRRTATALATSAECASPTRRRTR